MKTKITHNELVEIYNNNKNKLFTSCLKIVKDRHTAEDILQEIFLRLHKQDFSKIEDHIEMWLFTVCRNLSIKHYHKRERLVLIGDDFIEEEDEQAIIPDESLMNKERVQKLIKLYKKLPKKQLQAIKLRYYKDLDYNQIAKKMKTTSGNVGYMLSTGIGSLRAFFLKEKKNNKEY